MAEAMEAPEEGPTTQKIVELTRGALDRRDSSLLWAVDVARYLREAGLDIPSLPLAHALVACLFTLRPLPILSSYLHHALASQLVSSFHFVAVLTPRVLQNRLSRPEVYTLFLELASTYVFHLARSKALPCCDMVVKAVDEVLQLSVLSGTPVTDFGTVAVKFCMNLVWRLLDAISEDLTRFQKLDMTLQNPNQLDKSLEGDEGLEEHHKVEREQVRKANCIAALNLVSKIMRDKKTLSLLRLGQRNLADHWSMVAHHFQSLEALKNDILSKDFIDAVSQTIGLFQQGLCKEPNAAQFPVVQMLVEARSPSWFYGNSSEVGRGAAWLPLDIFMEDFMVGTRLIATSVVQTLAELVKSLQSIQNASWQDTFLALWISALRLLQQEIDQIEGPKPLSGSRLSVPLAVVPLTSALLIAEEEKQLATVCPESSSVGTSNEERTAAFGKRRAAFVASLKILGVFEDLLSPPQNLMAMSYQAAATAAAFVAGFTAGSMVFEGVGGVDGSSVVRTGANLRHMIVEICIARGLIDTSAYFWPGYVGALGNNISNLGTPQISAWKAYLDGAPLTLSLRNSLLSTPAKSVAELEKIYQAAVNGPEDERPVAASILCGASLMCGWNVQEHAVRLVLLLLSPMAPAESKINSHHLVQHAQVLYAVLGSIQTTDALQVLSLHGVISEVAAALLPICEVFGSLPPTVPSMAGSKEDVSVLAVFSMAFIILFKICKFHRAPLEHWTKDSGISLLNNTSLEYLILRYNMQAASSPSTPSGKPLTMDSFPRLKTWFLQHQSCIASGVSGPASSGDSLHQVGDRLLSMMLKKAAKSGSISSAPINTSSSDDGGGKPLLAAWDILAAVPYVVNSLLTACGQNKLQPRELTTGLRELVDFFPGSLPGIISFLEAEVTRGLWKPASMNGKDWPSPAANLLSVEAEMRDMLSSSGVNVPTCVPGSLLGNVSVTLPLPIATLLSLTITFKVDKFSELILSVAGPALQIIAGGSACTSVVAALWTQKVRRWHDFILLGSAEALIRKDKHAAMQVLKSCFSVTLGTCKSVLTAHGGGGALLGHGTMTAVGGRHPIPPGILFLRIIPSLHDMMFLPGEVLSLLVKSVREFVGNSAVATLKGGLRIRSSQSSLASTMSRIAQASSLAASFVFVAGGSMLGQLLYSETLASWFTSGHKPEGTPGSGKTTLLEGYAVAYFTFLSGVFIWGAAPRNGQTSTSRKNAVNSHMKFIASGLDGRISLACHPTTWKAYVRSLVSLVLACASSWISYVDVETLRRIAVSLRTWHEYDLAVALLESGGLTAMGVAGEFAVGL